MTTIDTLREVLIKDFALDGALISADSNLGQLGIDSLSLIDFVFKIEDRFALQIKDDPPDLLTLRDVAQYVDWLLAQKAQQSEASPAVTAPVEE